MRDLIKDSLIIKEKHKGVVKEKKTRKKIKNKIMRGKVNDSLIIMGKTKEEIKNKK